MTHRGRLLAALRRAVPDQVPVTWELEGRAAYALTGASGWKAICDAHRMVGSAIFNLQGVGPNLSCHMAGGYDKTSQRHQADGNTTEETRTFTTPRGKLVERWRYGHVEGDPTLAVNVEHLVKDPEDYGLLTDFFEAEANGAVPDLGTCKEAHEYIGEDGLVGFWMADPVYLAAEARSAELFVVDLMDKPGLVHRVLEAIDLLKEKELEAFNTSDADVLVYDLCFASLSLLNPPLVQEFVLPRARWLMEHVKRENKIVGFFTTGKIRAVLDRLVDLEPDFIQHFDVLGDCDLGEVKKTFGDRIGIVGNYSPVVLAKGSLDEARLEAKRCLDDAMVGGGYVLSTSDEVPPDAKLDNMRAVVEYVAEHGRY